jgi:hypothetical protein
MKKQTVAALCVVAFALGALVRHWLPPSGGVRVERAASGVEPSTARVLMSGEVLQVLPDGIVLNGSTARRDFNALTFVKGVTGVTVGSAWAGWVIPAGRSEHTYTNAAGRQISLGQHLVIK